MNVIVVGVGRTDISVLANAGSSEEDWAAFSRSTNAAGRHIADVARREGESWCVTVRDSDVTEAELDADDGVRAYCREVPADDRREVDPALSGE